MSRFTSVLTTGLAVTAVLALSACGGADEITPAAGTAEDPVRIGVVDSGDDYWNTFSDLAEEEGITVELVELQRLPAAQPGARPRASWT